MTKRIVIVGAGPAGIACAQALASALSPSDGVEVVLLEKSAFFFHAVGTPRAYVDASYVHKLFIPYDKAIPAAARGFVKIVRAVVTKITDGAKEVHFRKISASGEESSEVETLAFDYVVIATGSTYTVPIKPDPRASERDATEAKLKEVREAIERADKILVVGGGAVGCEVAGDIAARYPSKRVTIVEAREQLIAGNDVRDKFRSCLEHAMATLKIKVVLGERLTERLTGNGFEKRTLRTDKGTEIESDVQLLCGGFAPVTQLVADLDAALVDARGFIKVNDRLQLVGEQYAHVFALGDASDHATPKLAFWAGEQGKHLARELAGVVKGKQEAVAKPFPKVETEALLLPLGPGGGVSQLPVWGGVVVGGTLTWLIKGRDMFAAKTWWSLGASLPSWRDYV